MSLEWKKRSQEEQKVGYKYVTSKTFEMPDGRQGDYTTWGRVASQAAGVIALTTDNQVIVARQYRPGPEDILEELPGGFVDAGENIAEAAKRELLEETGYTTDESLMDLGHAVRDGYSNQTNHYFLARNCRQTETQQLDDSEFIEIVHIPIAKLIENAKTGKMSDPAAVLMAYDVLQEILDAQKVV